MMKFFLKSLSTSIVFYVVSIFHSLFTTIPTTLSFRNVVYYVTKPRFILKLLLGSDVDIVIMKGKLNAHHTVTHLHGVKQNGKLRNYA